MIEALGAHRRRLEDLAKGWIDNVTRGLWTARQLPEQVEAVHGGKGNFFQSVRTDIDE